METQFRITKRKRAGEKYHVVADGISLGEFWTKREAMFAIKRFHEAKKTFNISWV